MNIRWTLKSILGFFILGLLYTPLFPMEKDKPKKHRRALSSSGSPESEVKKGSFLRIVRKKQEKSKQQTPPSSFTESGVYSMRAQSIKNVIFSKKEKTITFSELDLLTEEEREKIKELEAEAKKKGTDIAY